MEINVRSKKILQLQLSLKASEDKQQFASIMNIKKVIISRYRRRHDDVFRITFMILMNLLRINRN